jgi:hypoxanthine phosphoribosyltransferase
MKRHIVQANDLQLDAFRLARKIFDSGFRPDFLVGLWRGGSAVGIAVQEGLDYLGVKTDHISVRTSYAGRDEYARMIGADARIRVHGLQYLLEHLNSENALLIVDDVTGTGRSTLEVIEKLSRKLRRNLPHDIRVAAVWHRPSERTVRPPDYYVRQTQDWLVLPYEITGLTRAEIAEQKDGMSEVLTELDDVLPQTAR